jgi:hypothetical protein
MMRDESGPADKFQMLGKVPAGGTNPAHHAFNRAGYNHFHA